MIDRTPKTTGVHTYVHEALWACQGLSGLLWAPSPSQHVSPRYTHLCSGGTWGVDFGVYPVFYIVSYTHTYIHTHCLFLFPPCRHGVSVESVCTVFFWLFSYMQKAHLVTVPKQCKVEQHRIELFVRETNCSSSYKHIQFSSLPASWSAIRVYLGIVRVVPGVVLVVPRVVRVVLGAVRVVLGVVQIVLGDGTRVC